MVLAGALAGAAPASAQSPASLAYVFADGRTTGLSPDVALPVADLAPRVRFAAPRVRLTTTAPDGSVAVGCSVSGSYAGSGSEAAEGVVPYRGNGTYRVAAEALDPADVACAGPARASAVGVLDVRPQTDLVPLPAAVIRRSYAVVDATPPYRTTTNTTPVLFGAVQGAGSYRVALTPAGGGPTTTQQFASPAASRLVLPPPGRYVLTASASPSPPGTPDAVFAPEGPPHPLQVRDQFAPVARLSGTVQRRGRGFALGTRATRVEVSANPQLRPGERVTLALSRLHGRRFGHFETRARARIVAVGAKRIARATIRPGRQGTYRLRVSYSGGELVARRAVVVYVLRLVR